MILTNVKDELARWLQRIQNSCLRFILLRKCSDRLIPCYRRLSLLKLNERQNLHELTLVFKIFPLQQLSYLNERFQSLSSYHDCNTRSRESKLLLVTHHSSNSYFKCFTVQAWNDLLPEIRQLHTISTFKKSVSDLLQSNLSFYTVDHGINTVNSKIKYIKKIITVNAKLFSKYADNIYFLYFIIISVCPCVLLVL